MASVRCCIKWISLLLSIALAGPVFAQQPMMPQVPPQPSASEQALSERLLSEIQSNVQARAQLIEVQRQLTAAQTKIKDLEAAHKKTTEVVPDAPSTPR